MSASAVDESMQPVPRWRRFLRGLREFADPHGNPAEAIYGTLLAGVVLATKAHKGVSGASVFWSALGALILYWIAHVYAGIIGEQIKNHRRPTRGELGHICIEHWSRLRASLIPVIFFEIVRLARGSLNTSVLSALWLTVVLLAAWGATAAYRSGARGVALVVESLVAGVLGVLVVLLKIVLH